MEPQDRLLEKVKREKREAEEESTKERQGDEGTKWWDGYYQGQADALRDVISWIYDYW